MNWNPDKIVTNEQLPILENERALEKLRDRIESKLSAYTPNPEDFIDEQKEGYYSNDVENDLNYVTRLEEKWKKEASEMKPEDRQKYERIKNIATITEGIMIDQLSGSWLNVEGNENYQIIAHPTSKYDDYHTGADVALEILNKKTNEDSHLGLSIDITYSSDTAKIKEKLNRIFSEINSGEQPYIKYFENDAETYMGRVDIARCVLVLSQETVSDLFKKEFNRDKEGLQQHPVQLSLVAQMEEQSKVFHRLAVSRGNQTMAKIYEQILDNLRLLKASKKSENQRINDEGSLMDSYKGLKLLYESLVEYLL